MNPYQICDHLNHIDSCEFSTISRNFFCGALPELYEYNVMNNRRKNFIEQNIILCSKFFVKPSSYNLIY